MLATRGDHPPSGDGWIHEVKWDGIRLLAEVDQARVSLTSRNGNDVTGGYPELAELGAGPGSGRDLLLDGEVVAFRDGIPSFAALADRMHVRDKRKLEAIVARNPATYLIFDLLRLDGRDLRGLSLRERREILESLDLSGPHWQVPPVYDDGDMLMRATEQQGLEGVISKRLASRYESGARSRHWLKFPHRRRTSWVVGGWRPETGSEHRLGAVLVGIPTADGLHFMGRVGSGIAGRNGPPLLELLRPLGRDTNPFDEVPRVDAAGTRWVEPQIVVDVESLGLAGSGRLRQPAFIGVRDDLTPDDLADQQV